MFWGEKKRKKWQKRQQKGLEKMSEKERKKSNKVREEWLGNLNFSQSKNDWGECIVLNRVFL